MQELYDNMVKEYEQELEEILLDNIKYIEEHKIEYNSNNSIYNGSLHKLRCVIPILSVIPGYKYYTGTNINIMGIEDPVLRYIPFLNDINGIKDDIKINFEYTSMSETPLNREEEIKNRIIKNILNLHNDKELFKLKNAIERKKVDKKYFIEKFTMLEDLGKFINIPIYDILKRWEHFFDKKVKQLFFDKIAFNSYFCTVCMLFDCLIHECCNTVLIKEGEYKCEDHENKKKIKYNENEKECNLYQNDTFNEINKSIIENDTMHKSVLDSETINASLIRNNAMDNSVSNFLLNKDCDIDSKNNTDIADITFTNTSISNKNMLLNIYTSLSSTEIKILRKICESFEIDGCGARIILRYFSGINRLCSEICSTMVNVLNIRNKMNFKKKLAPKFTFKKNYSLSEFYTPCNHKGSCLKNKNCNCYKNNTFCELACLCRCCNNFFKGCKCVSCNDKCDCLAVNRECTNNCGCYAKRKNGHYATNKKVYIYPSKVAGYGLYANEKIRKNEYVIEYKGEIITNEEAERRGVFTEKKKCTYLFDLSKINKNYHNEIDALRIGNAARFINHSNNPNLKALTIQHSGIKKIVFKAIKDIEIDEELFFNYNFNQEHKIKHMIKE